MQNVLLSARQDFALLVLSLGCDIGRCSNGNLAALDGVLKLRGRIALNKLSPFNRALSDVQEPCRFAIRPGANS
jgi:hypothetical protein